MSNLKTPRSYEDDFDGDWFLAEYFRTMEAEGDLLKFRVDMLHDLFVSGTIKGQTLLDIGTGPCVYSVISASRHVTEIHLSEYTAKNRDILQNWRDGAPNAKCVFEYISKKEKDGTPIAARVNEVRDKVTQLHVLDLMQPQPKEEPDCQYDVITSSLCLEAVAQTVEMHCDFLAKVADMLKPGGFFVLVGVTGCSFYRVGNFRFYNLAINTDQVKSNIEKAGFEIKVWKEAGSEGYKSDVKQTYLFEDLFVMAAQKPIV